MAARTSLIVTSHVHCVYCYTGDRLCFLCGASWRSKPIIASVHDISVPIDCVSVAKIMIRLGVCIVKHLVRRIANNRTFSAFLSHSHESNIYGQQQTTAPEVVRFVDISYLVSLSFSQFLSLSLLLPVSFVPIHSLLSLLFSFLLSSSSPFFLWISFVF